MEKISEGIEFLVILGVGGELIADGGIFLFSERLQVIADAEYPMKDPERLMRLCVPVYPIELPQEQSELPVRPIEPRAPQTSRLWTPQNGLK